MNIEKYSTYVVNNFDIEEMLQLTQISSPRGIGRAKYKSINSNLYEYGIEKNTSLTTAQAT